VLQAQIKGGRASTYMSAHSRTLLDETTLTGRSAVPVCGAGRHLYQLQALLPSQCYISGAQWRKVQEGSGGSFSCFACRKKLRSAKEAVLKYPGWHARKEERGAHLGDLHSALVRAAEGVWSSNRWMDRFILDGTGAQIS